MWNVEERFAPKAIESLAALGFAVGSTRGVVRVEKYGCGAEFRQGTDAITSGWQWNRSELMRLGRSCTL